MTTIAYNIKKHKELKSSKSSNLSITGKKFFFLSGFFFHGHWKLTGQQGKGENHLLFHSTTSTWSRTFRHLFLTLHVRWLPHISYRTACTYQTATQWDLPPSRITIWLIDDVMLVFVCLLDDLIQKLTRETGGVISQRVIFQRNKHPVQMVKY